jgi:hypothetical protein
VAGLAVAGIVAPSVPCAGLTAVPIFWLTLSYEDVAGNAWVMRARYVKPRDGYEDLTIERRHASA